MVATLDEVFREEWGRVLATLIGVLGEFDLAEDATQEAFAIAAVARGGEILMCASTYQTVRGRYPDAERVELELKGKELRVQAFRLRVT